MWISCSPSQDTWLIAAFLLKMTSHKHSFQCFDAVVEKPSLTAGHNSTASSHSSTCTSTHLGQLENRRCSLCSESQQGKPVTSEVSGNQPASWYQPQSPSHQHTPRRPMRPEEDPVYGVAHHHRNHHHQHHTHRHRKRIVLVKNSNLSIQKTILLHRKPVHSLSVFMDDVSELMQCHIRKLYTLDGHRVRALCGWSSAVFRHLVTWYIYLHIVVHHHDSKTNYTGQDVGLNDSWSKNIIPADMSCVWVIHVYLMVHLFVFNLLTHVVFLVKTNEMS